MDGTVPKGQGINGRKDCWVNGLRNGYKSTWDLKTGRFFVGEVGGNNHATGWEDVHILSPDSGDANLGWPLCEGLACGIAKFDKPAYAYAHDGEASCIVGGPLYRGKVSRVTRNMEEMGDPTFATGASSSPSVRVWELVTLGKVAANSGNLPLAPCRCSPR